VNKETDKGPEDLLEQNKKQIEYLQRQCRKAGKAILNQEVQIGGLKKEIDRLAEENDNLRRMISSNDDTE
jgi:septal ring factor EnvC (AmiA/AmiB activator)